MSITIRSLHVYPIKSCRGIDLQQAQLVETGIEFDRHWMLVDESGKFLSQREHPHLARIGCAFDQEFLRISCDGHEDLLIPLQQASDERQSVRIWHDQCEAARVSASASDWFSRAIGQACDLVYLPQDEIRQVDTDYAAPGQRVGFADGFPLLVVSHASVELLNTHLQQKVGIERFRPNIVLDGCAAHAEDDWQSIQIGDLTIKLAKPCSRCAIPGYDQQTGEKHEALLPALASYRRGKDYKIYFGQNGLHSGKAVLQVNDEVSFVQR